MTYLGVLSLDFNAANSNAYNKLQNAIVAAGFDYADTSTYIIEAEDLQPILLCMELLSRSIQYPGEVSALSLTVHLQGPPKNLASAPNHPRALDELLDRPLPSTLL